MSGLVTISRQGVFSLGEARSILPVIRRITADYSQYVEALIARLESLSNGESDQIESLEAHINEQICEWHNKIRKLGGVPKGLWLVDFDSGDGYLCWKYPETEILYWHSYTDGFTKRVPITEKDFQDANSPRSNQSDLR